MNSNKSTKSNFDNIRYSFIIGIGRSGTNLLSKLLNNHKSIMTSLEFEFVIFFHHHFSKREQFFKEDFKLICDFFKLHSYYHPILNEIIDLKQLYKDLCSQKFNSYGDLTKFLHLQFNFLKKPVESIEIMIDKNSSYLLHIARLLKLDKRAKFICLMRDYRANILSRKQSIEHRSPNTAFNSYRWLFYNKRIAKELKRNKKLLLVKYKDLVASPESKLNELYQFLGVSDDASSKCYENQNPSVLFNSKIKSINSRHENVISKLEAPVFTPRIEAWRTELPINDIEMCEAICGKFGVEMGYEISQNLSIIKVGYLKFISFPQYLRACYDYYKESLLNGKLFKSHEIDYNHL